MFIHCYFALLQLLFTVGLLLDNKFLQQKPCLVTLVSTIALSPWDTDRWSNGGNNIFYLREIYI